MGPRHPAPRAQVDADEASSDPAGSLPPSAGRQLVVCCDGTSNTLSGGRRDTNVLQLHARLRADRERRASTDPGGPEQVLYYDPGVGSAVEVPPAGLTDLLAARVRRTAGLALGTGVYENIGQAYLHLCREYGRRDPEVDPATGRPPTTTTDEIWLFGFSRGAFTVRAVGGMINLFGLIRPEHEVLLPTLLSVYFSAPSPEPADADPGAADATGGRSGVRLVGAQPGDRAMAAAVAGTLARAVERGSHAMSQDPAVMLAPGEAPVDADPAAGGVGGSAAANGAAFGPAVARPTREALAAQIRAEFTAPVGRDARVRFVGVWDTVDSVGILPGARKRISSPPTIHTNRYDHVRHALALDEHRRQFLPRPFDGRTAEGQTLTQLWFRGVHSDIGGSRPSRDSLLSHETLAWMVDEAIACGLRVSPVRRERDPAEIVEVIGDQLRAQPAWALTGMALRDPRVAPSVGRPGATGAPAPPAQHESVGRLTRAPGAGPAQRGVPRSPWERGNGPRAGALLIVTGLAASIAGVLLVVAGALVAPGPFAGQVGASARAGLSLLWEQLSLLWPSGDSGGSTLADRLSAAGAVLEERAAADRDGAHASYGWAQVVLAGSVLAASIVVARVPARAFGRLTRWRRVTTPHPRPHWAMNALGLGYAAMVLAYLAQVAALVGAWSVGRSPVRGPLLAAAAEAQSVAALGLLLTVALVLLWGLRELTGRGELASRSR